MCERLLKETCTKGYYPCIHGGSRPYTPTAPRGRGRGQEMAGRPFLGAALTMSTPKLLTYINF